MNLVGEPDEGVFSCSTWHRPPDARVKFATRVFSLQADFSRRLEKRPALRGPGEHAQSLIQPPADDTLCADKVTTRVNNPDYQEDELRPAHTSSDPNASGSS